jgi:hypothetical protein
VAQLEFTMTRTILFGAFAIAALLTAPTRLDAQHSTEQAGLPSAVASAQAHQHDGAPSLPAKPDIETLVIQMNAATGAAKIDAVAAVLTALVQKQKDCETKMAGMTSRMGGHANAAEGQAGR